MPEVPQSSARSAGNHARWKLLYTPRPEQIAQPEISHHKMSAASENCGLEGSATGQKDLVGLHHRT